MDRTVGNLLLYFLLIISIPISAATLSLQLTDMQGEPLEDALVGEPFLMVVSATDIDEEQQEPSIKGMQDFYVKRVSQRLMMVNGARSVQYHYQVRIDKAGTYNLGPAYYTDTQDRSKAVRIKVLATRDHQDVVKPKQPTERTKNTDTKREPVLLRLWVDNDAVYVGQKIKTVLRFYYLETESITVEQVTAEDPVSITMTEKQGPKKGSQEIDGKRYNFYEWQWDMFPTQAGQLVIPAYSLDYAKHLPMDTRLGGWAALLGPRYERKRIYSNALTLQVRPLPPIDKEVHAVGHFTQYRASMNSAVAKQYEGMVLSLAIEGVGNMQALQLPDLVMPDALKWYSSKQSVDDLSTGQRKIFEYIVQGLQAGDWEIPEQTFTFFDVNTSSYRQLKTAPLFVTVLPGHMSAPIVQQKEMTKPIGITTKQSDDIEPIIENMHNAQAAQPVSWWLFICLMLIPVFYVVGSFMLSKAAMILQLIAPHYAQRQAFASAKKQLDQAALEHRSDKIWPIIMHLFATRLERPVAALSLDDMMQVILNSSWSQEDKQRFELFVLKLSETAYGVSTEHAANESFFNETMVWIDKLEGVI